MSYGLIIDEIKQEDYVFGDALLGDTPVGADWSKFLPALEVQNLNNVEPFACASFATLNCVETLLRQEYSQVDNYSDRFLASVSGTAALRGNSPHTVAETLRKEGTPFEKEYPFDAKTFDEYYAPVPDNVRTLAKQFVTNYSFGHSYVPLAPQDLMNALAYSPLGFSVCAWHLDGNGYYYRPEGARDNHFVMCYGYEVGDHWKIFDSYTQDGTVLKKLRWDAIPMQAKRYTLHKSINHVFLKNLYYGITNEEVAMVQKALGALGYSIPHGVTDFYGNETKAAVAQFQAKNGIVDDGSNFGPRTRLALNRALQPNIGALESLLLTIRTYAGY